MTPHQHPSHSHSHHPPPSRPSPPPSATHLIQPPSLPGSPAPSSPNAVPGPSPTPFARSSPPRSKSHIIATTNNSHLPLHNQSNALLSSLSANPAAYTPDGTKKLTKWLTRNRAKSVGAATALSGAAASTSNSGGSGGAGPVISVSPSSSVGSNLAVQGVEQRLGGSTSPTRVRSATSSHGGDVEEGKRSGFAATMSLRTSRRGRGAGDEVLEEWATADVVDDEEMGREINGRREGSGGGKHPGAKGGLFNNLKRTKSHLKMFGGGGKGDELDASPSTDQSKRLSRASRESGSPPTGSPPYNDSLSLYRSSTSSFQIPPTPSSPFGNSPSGQPQSQNGNVAGRLGGWFSSMLHSTSSSHLPLPLNNLEPSPSPPASRPPSIPNAGPSSVRQTSPKKVSAPRLGPLDRILDKAVQYFLDTDSAADKCEDDIWVLGVRHPGYVPPPPSTPDTDAVEVLSTGSGSSRDREEKQRKHRSVPSVLGGRGKKAKGKERKHESVDVNAASASVSHDHSSTAPPNAIGVPPSDDQSDTLSIDSSRPSSVSISPQPSFRGLPSSLGPTSSALLPPGTLPPQTYGWPVQFYFDFYSRVALTYRTGFPPIPCAPAQAGGHGLLNSLSMSIGRGPPRASEGLSSDTGWGCMLRTGQSLLANTLITVHLGRDWRRPLPPPPPSVQPNSPTTPTFASPPPAPPLAPSHADYARILSLFLDSPSPLAPFSVHRFALMGKQLGKEVGEWFGPSTAAGAIKALVNDFEPAGLAVCSVVDGTVYKSDVEAVSMGKDGDKWAKPVLVLIGLRLGIDGVNPIYHEAVKGIFSFPQSVGIAGGRPSSSYYFVGAQANSLFYIDPHHPRPSIALQTPSLDLVGPVQVLPLSIGLSSAQNGISDSFVTVVPSPTAASPPLPIDGLGRLAEFFVEAYPDEKLRTYHSEKVRKMALSSLDPSMLLGFLIRDEEDWDDFSARVRQLSQAHSPIFSLADSPPAWMRRSTNSGGPSAAQDESASSDGVGSFSEPDDWELDSLNAASAPPDQPVEDGEEEDEDDDDEWVDRDGPSERSPSPSMVVRQPSPLLPMSIAGEKVRRRSIERSWQTVADPEAAGRADEEGVVVSTPAVGGATILVSAPEEHEERPHHLEDGWEGVRPPPRSASASDESVTSEGVVGGSRATSKERRTHG